MKLLRLLFIAFLAGGITFAQTTSSKSVVDDMNNEVAFTSSPQRVITLAPNLTEMIYKLGAGKTLVGNTLYCNYPIEAAGIEKVGDILTFDYEKIISLNPDLLFITVEGNTKAAYEKFLELGIKVFVSNPRDFDGIKKTFLDMGKIFNKETIAEDLVAGWDSIVDEIQTLSKNYKPKTVMFLIESNPIMLAGKNTFLNEFVRICGMINLAEDSPINYPIYNREEILVRNPDYIVYPTGGKHSISAITDIYPEWKNLTAIKKEQVVFLHWDLFSRPGPRFVEALQFLFSRLHP